MTPTIVYAGWGLVKGEPQTDFAVCVQANTIIAVGTRTSLMEQYPQAAFFGGANYLMTPAFVNSHDHGRAWGSLFGGVPDDILEVWLMGLGNQLHLSPYLAAAWEGIQLVKSGVGSTAHSHNPATWEGMFAEIPATLRGYADAGVRVAMHPPLIDQNRLVYTDTEAFIAGLPVDLQPLARASTMTIPLSHDEYFSGLNALHTRYHDTASHRVHIQVSPAGGQWCSDELITRSMEWAKAQNTRVQMHLLETVYQRDYAQQQFGRSFPQHLAALGVLNDRLTLAHMVWTDEADLALLAESGVGIAHNPSSNLRLMSGVAPLAALLHAGVNLGIGMDGHTLDDDQDYLREMRLAWTLAHRPGAASLRVSPAIILTLGTSQGAAITFGAEVPLGELRVGALADLVLFDWPAMLGSYARVDDMHLLPHLFLRRAQRQHVRHVMVNGVWQVQDGRHTQLDENAIADAMRAEVAPQIRRTVAAPLADHVRRFYAGKITFKP